MGLTGVHAGGKSVQAADAMGKALIFKELKRAIGNRGLVAETLGGQSLQKVIGPHRPVALKKDFQ